MVTEKILAELHQLNVRAKLSDYAGKSTNRNGGRHDLRVGSNEVDEWQKLWVGDKSEGAWGESFWQCIGSLVIASNMAMFTHNYAHHSVSSGNFWGDIGGIKNNVGVVESGVAVVWRRNFSDKHRDQKQAVDLFSRELLKIYGEHGIHGLIADFEYTENPMSGYFDGNNTLTFTANGIDKKSLFSPTISSF